MLLLRYSCLIGPLMAWLTVDVRQKDMPITITATSVHIGSAATSSRAIGSPRINGAQIIPFTLFPAWYSHHICVVPNTQRIEAYGSALSAGGFTFPNCGLFIRDVCRWGGYAGIAGRVLNANTTQYIMVSFSAAVRAGSVTASLRNINVVKNLGTPSFASKHLRMIDPNRFPVLDSILANALGYSFSTSGYGAFAQDCATLVAALASSGITHPFHHAWRVGDVETAIFACLQL